MLYAKKIAQGKGVVKVIERLEYWAAQMFNDIHRGVPLISRAVLVARLRELRRSEIEV